MLVSLFFSFFLLLFSVLFTMWVQLVSSTLLRGSQFAKDTMIIKNRIAAAQLQICKKLFSNSENSFMPQFMWI